MYVYNIINPVNADHAIDSVNISCRIKGKDEELIDDFLETYGMHDGEKRIFYYNRYGKVDSFVRRYHLTHGYYDSSGALVWGAEMGNVLAEGRYDSVGNLKELKYYSKDNTNKWHKEVDKTFTSKFDSSGRLVEIISADSDYCRRITYKADSIIEEILDIKFHPDPDVPYTDKIFRSVPGLGLDFFGWTDKYHLRKIIQVFKSGKLTKLVEEFNYHDPGLTVIEIFYEYNSKGQLVSEQSYLRDGTNRHLVLRKDISYFRSGKTGRIDITARNWRTTLKFSRSGKQINEYLVPIHRSEDVVESIWKYKRSGYRIIYRIYY